MSVNGLKKTTMALVLNSRSYIQMYLSLFLLPIDLLKIN